GPATRSPSVCDPSRRALPLRRGERLTPEPVTHWRPDPSARLMVVSSSRVKTSEPPGWGSGRLAGEGVLSTQRKVSNWSGGPPTGGAALRPGASPPASAVQGRPIAVRCGSGGEPLRCFPLKHAPCQCPASGGDLTQLAIIKWDKSRYHQREPPENPPVVVTSWSAVATITG